MILVIIELANNIDKLMVRDMIFNVILPDINCIIEKTEFHDNSLPELVLKLLTSPILDELLKYILYVYFNCRYIYVMYFTLCKHLLHFHIIGITIVLQIVRLRIIQSSAFWSDVLVQNLHILQVCLGFWKQ